MRSTAMTGFTNVYVAITVGGTAVEGSRTLLGSLLLGYYTPDGRLLYAGRVGTGMSEKKLRMLHQRLTPLAIDKMPLVVAHLGRAGSEERCRSRRCIGLNQSSSLRSPISLGRTTVYSATPCLLARERTSLRSRCDVRAKVSHRFKPSLPRQQIELWLNCASMW
jgi:ATP dependent DNA ligase C terminal region